MSFFPDEMWNKILEMGVSTHTLSCRDLCSISITSRRHNRLSGDPSLWSILVTLDFPQESQTNSSSPPSKSLYKIMFERCKARRVAARRRAILIAESSVAVCLRRIEELERRRREEEERMKAAVQELGNLERVRQASVALNVWQPVVVRGSQRQMVEQCTVPIASRLSDLQMEVTLCKQQIASYKKAHAEQMRRLRESKEALAALKYSPLETYPSSESGS